MTATKNEILKFVVGWMWERSWFFKRFEYEKQLLCLWTEVIIWSVWDMWRWQVAGEVGMLTVWQGTVLARHLAPDFEGFWSHWGSFKAPVMQAALWVLIWRCLEVYLKLMREWSRLTMLSSLIWLVLSPWVDEYGFCADCLVLRVHWFLVYKGWKEKIFQTERSVFPC